jgi:hypothetical protein
MAIVTASGIIKDYRLRGINPDNAAIVTQGTLLIWEWNDQYVAELVMGDSRYSTPGSYRKSLSFQEIADDIEAWTYIEKHSQHADN